MDTCTPGALQIADGTYYEPLNFKPEDVKVDMIAHQLALKCRWNGNTNDLTEECEPVLYVVGQHSCLAHDLARDHKEHFAPEIDWSQEACPSTYALFHDAGEGPYIDVPRPLKDVVPALKEFEKPIIGTILKTLDIPLSPAILTVVHRIDNALLFWERDALVGKPLTPYASEHTHPGGTLYDWFPDFEAWGPSQAKREFLQRFYDWEESFLVV